MYKWELLTQLQTDLQTKLGEEAYNEAWERGQALDLDEVVQDLIDEFSQSE